VAVLVADLAAVRPAVLVDVLVAVLPVVLADALVAVLVEAALLVLADRAGVLAALAALPPFLAVDVFDFAVRAAEAFCALVIPSRPTLGRSRDPTTVPDPVMLAFPGSRHGRRGGSTR
jgi:hypothetical protein